MTNPIYYQNPATPAYSGVTINITNPTLNAVPQTGNYPAGCFTQSQDVNAFNNCHQPQFVYSQVPQNYYMQPQMPQGQMMSPMQTSFPVGQDFLQNNAGNLTSNPLYAQQMGHSVPVNNQVKEGAVAPENNSQAYPASYYLNNYNYIQNGEKGDFQQPNQALNQVQKPIEKDFVSKENVIKPNYNIVPQQEDMSSSENIKNELDARLAEQKELEKNGTKTKVVALTNEYIMSLENYLNNPNTEIRLMAAKEILTRLDEDKDRHDDAALNALLNKMLQDPEKLIRVAALSAFSSQLASGNELTFELLNNIQNNPGSDKEDVVQAADCLLKMSSSTETKFIPAQKQLAASQNDEV